MSDRGRDFVDKYDLAHELGADFFAVEAKLEAMGENPEGYRKLNSKK